MAGVVQLADRRLLRSEDPNEEKPLCVHGNPGMLTRDTGTSRLAQGCTGQLTVVNVEKFANPARRSGVRSAGPVIWPRPPKLEAAGSPLSNLSPFFTGEVATIFAAGEGPRATCSPQRQSLGP